MKIYLEELRTNQKLSISELAEKSGVAKSHIHSIESGDSVPTLTVACKLCRALNAPQGQLFSCDD